MVGSVRRVLGEEEELPNSRTRLYGTALAFVIAAAVASIVTVIGTGQPGPGLITDWIDFILAACLAAVMLSIRVRGRRYDGAGDVTAMAVVTYVIGVLLFPIVQLVATLPSVSNGGLIPCPSYPFGGTLYEGCASGLHGSAAWDALISVTVEYYKLTHVALLVLSPLLVVLAVPSLVWVRLMRRFAGVTDPRYQRS
jgi:hypothetical protein